VSQFTLCNETESRKDGLWYGAGFPLISEYFIGLAYPLRIYLGIPYFAAAKGGFSFEERVGALLLSSTIWDA
jgi:hypothetical protein